MRRINEWGGLAVLALMCLASVPVAAQTVISADGIIESSSGGFRFPDGTSQTSAAVGNLVPVEDTGQTLCVDELGNPRDCAGTGEDAEHRAGVAWPTPRYSDNGGGTVTDQLTGLVWLKGAYCPGVSNQTWQEALQWVEDSNTTSIACTDYTPMTFTDWRLPSIKELLSLIDCGRRSPALPDDHLFVNVQLVGVWSYTSFAQLPSAAWIVGLNSGNDTAFQKTSTVDIAWAVRGGQLQVAEQWTGRGGWKGA